MTELLPKEEIENIANLLGYVVSKAKEDNFEAKYLLLTYASITKEFSTQIKTDENKDKTITGIMYDVLKKHCKGLKKIMVIKK